MPRLEHDAKLRKKCRGDRDNARSKYKGLEFKIFDIENELTRTSAQLATARENHCGDDPSSSRFLGNHQDERERAQNFPAQLGRRGTSAQARARWHHDIDDDDPISFSDVSIHCGL